MNQRGSAIDVVYALRQHSHSFPRTAYLVFYFTPSSTFPTNLSEMWWWWDGKQHGCTGIHYGSAQMLFFWGCAVLAGWINWTVWV